MRINLNRYQKITNQWGDDILKTQQETTLLSVKMATIKKSKRQVLAWDVKRKPCTVEGEIDSKTMEK